MAFVWMGVADWVSGDGGLLMVGLAVEALAEFLRRVMRLICFVSDLVKEGRSLLALSAVVEG